MSIDEVLDQACGLIDSHGIRQDPLSRTSDYPDRRSFRMYRSQGLIDAPTDKAGTAGVYGRKHVLQLVAVKRLQVARLPLREIRDRLASAAESDLAAMLSDSSDERVTRTKDRTSSCSHESTNTNEATRWVRIDLNAQAFAMVSEEVLGRSRPSSLRALADQFASRLLALRSEAPPPGR